MEKPHFEITHLQSNADVEYVEDKPVLHKWMDVTVRLYKGFHWDSYDETKALLKKLRAAEELNDE